MKFIGFSAHRNIAGITAGFLLGGVALATAVAPASSAAPDCSAAGIAGTTSAVTGPRLGAGKPTRASVAPVRVMPSPRHGAEGAPSRVSLFDSAPDGRTLRAV